MDQGPLYGVHTYATLWYSHDAVTVQTTRCDARLRRSVVGCSYVLVNTSAWMINIAGWIMMYVAGGMIEAQQVVRNFTDHPQAVSVCSGKCFHQQR